MTDFRGRLQQAATWAGVGESQATIATSLNLNRQTINRWFQGGEPNADMLLHIASSWGVDAEWLKSGKGEMLPKPPEEWSNEERELVRDFRQASAQVRQVIRTMVRAARKSVVLVALAIPPLLVPTPAESSFNITRICIACRRWLRSFMTDANFGLLAK